MVIPLSEPGDLFRAAASYYARFRAGYPDAFFRHIVTRFALDGTQRLLDLGCGTGQLTLPLAASVAEAIGVDPEPEMLVEAQAAAARAGITNITWRAGSDRDLDALRDTLGPIDLVTIGRAFHWMTQDATLRSLDRIIVPDGGLVIVGDDDRIWESPGQWQEAVRGVIQRWLGPVRRAGSGTRTALHDPFGEILARSPFARVEPYTLNYERTATTEEIVGYLYSTSYCSPAVLGAQREAFEADLRQTLQALNPSGIFAEAVHVGAWLAWRQ